MLPKSRGGLAFIPRELQFLHSPLEYNYTVVTTQEVRLTDWPLSRQRSSRWNVSRKPGQLHTALSLNSAE